MIKIIYIMWLRQIKRYWRSKSRIIGSIGQPMLYLVAMGFGLGGIYQKAGGGNYIDFLAPGVISQSIMFMAVFNGVDLIWDKQFGFLKETLVAPVSRLEIILGRVLGGATISVIQGILVFLLTLVVGFKPENLSYVLPSVGLMFLIGLFYASLGTAIASLMKDFHGFQLIMNFLIMPSYFLSGALFPLDSAPPALQTIASFNPLTYGVSGLRQLMAGTVNYSLGIDILILLVLSSITLSIASYLFTKIEA